ncbi:MAG: tetraacyldisaccharide 4'-kinase [Candidatus Saelkia tenebricola]|nr:tetraacyldisaccharide 4'-kinase [Candidatus Saelkia tenebricola]
MNIGIEKAYSNLINSESRNFFILVILFILGVLSYVYLCVIKVLRLIRTKKQISYKVPIISIGNITWGGTGKTPFVIEIARYLKERNVEVAIVHHGRSYQDEVKMMADKLGDIPVFQEKTKRVSIEKAVSSKVVDVIILDDGYQQWGIKKEIEVLCLNYKLPFGNGFLIPRGNLREEITAIKRADIIVFNKADNYSEENMLTEDVKQYNSQAPIIFSRYKVKEAIDILDGTAIDLDVLRNMEGAVLTAVADPDSVINTLRVLGADVKQSFLFPDHHDFSKEDLFKVAADLDREIKNIFITEKDYIKIKDKIDIVKKAFSGNKVFLIKINLEFLKNAEALFGRLDILLARLNG